MVSRSQKIDHFVELIVGEVYSAMDKFPPFHSAHEGYAVILEELDELWEEVKKQYGPERDRAMRKEAIQVAAMAIRFLVDCHLVGCEP